MPDVRGEREVRDTSRAGATVRIKGLRGTYTLHEEVLTETGAQWVTLFGGSNGHNQWRHVRPDRIVWPKQRRTA